MSTEAATVPIWSFARRVDRRGREDSELLSVYRDHGVVPKSSRDDNFNKESDDLSNYLYVEQGDLVLNKMKTWQGSLAVSKFEGIVSPAYFVCQLSPQVEPRFIHYLLRSEPLIAEYAKRSKGIRPNQWDLPFDEFKAIEVTLPPVEEQRRIADFLDDQVSRIDALAASIDRYLSLIRERFEAIRHSLVTGTSSNSDSVGSARDGLEWLEELPPGWRMVPLRTLFEFSKGRDAQRLTKEYVAAHPGEYPVFSGQTGSQGLFGRIDTYDFEVIPGAILVTTVGASAMTTRVVAGRLSLSQNCALMAPRQSMPMQLVQFLEYQLRSIMAVRRSEIPDHMQPSLRVADLAGYRVALPPRNLLTPITETLEVHGSIYDEALTERQSQIALLEERKASLIAAAVTGTLGIATAEAVGVG